MFLDIWEVALNSYNLEKKKYLEEKKKRDVFKLKNNEIRKIFNLKYQRFKDINKNKFLYKLLLIRLINNNKNQEFIEYYNKTFFILKFNYNFYRYEKVKEKFRYLIFNYNFFRYEKVSDKVYKIYLKWEYVYFYNKTNETLFHEINTKFYCKHDYPYEKYNIIYNYLNNNGYYLDLQNRAYLLDKLFKIWNGTFV